ncbi:MAG: hypothetical protein ABL907_01840 [Hyphomicrobium sp.]
MQLHKNLVRGIAALGFVVSLSGVSIAADTKAIETSIATMAACSGIMEKIVAERVPRGHPQFRANLKSHEATKNTEHRPAQDAAHVAFTRFIETKVRELDDCGKKHKVQLRAAWQSLRGLQSSGALKSANDPSVVVVKKFHGETTKLTESVVKLTHDRQVQSYLSKPLLEHFAQKHD